METDVHPAVGEFLPRLLDGDEETVQEHWDLVREVVRNHEPADVLAAATVWCNRPEPDVQAVGLDLLGDLGVNVPAARDQLLEAGRVLLYSSDCDVRWSLALALGANSTDERTTPLLLALMDDEDEDVRFRATAGLSVQADDEPAQGPVVDALLGALDDPCAEVRDWAAFALGVQRDVDTSQVRNALLSRLSDDEADTPGEAAVALARRGDPRVFDPLLERFSDPDVGNLWVEAAAELGDSRLLPALLHLKSSGWQDGDPRPGVLDEAIERCSAPTVTAEG
ncbi:HEAT repeat domain-containing protein [Actinomadura scrupuli]|uniref:HEAT repeat domain-containing protein n=1 Tax=Actinomadura scrupuli TaxID=559629 RepID=UPI003D9954BB